MIYVTSGELNILKLKPTLLVKNGFSGFIQQRLDYIFVSQNLQERTRNVDILNAVSTDHSPVFCSFVNSTEFHKGPAIWKFSNSLIFDRNFVKEMKCFIHNTKKRPVTDHIFDEQSQWEILKYEMRKFSIRYTKLKRKGKKEQGKKKKQHELESKLKIELKY